jgi:X-linked retinitis pigmentosa GTPase regulator
MRHRTAPALCLALAALLGLAACGEEDAQLLGGETAREINANLDTVQQLADEGDCTGAESAVEQVGEQIDGLEEVDPRLKRALEEGAGRLEEVIATCEESTTESIGPARIPDEEEDEGEEDRDGDGRDERQQGQGRDGDDEDRGGSGEDGGAPESGDQPPPPASEGEANGKGPEGEGPPGQSEGEDEESGGISPGSAVEAGE